MHSIWRLKKEKIYVPKKEKKRIFIATDLHYLSSELTDYGSLFQSMIRCSDGKVTIYEEELLDAFVEEVREEKPDALILTGDLTFDGAKISHINLRKKLEKIRKSGIKVYVIPGNHDLCKKNDAYRFLGEKLYPEEGLQREEFADFYEAFGYKFAIARDRDSLSYVAELPKGLRLFFIDVNGVNRNKKGNRKNEGDKEKKENNLAPNQATLDWIEKQLKKAKKKNIQCISFSHQNLLSHNKMQDSGFLMENCEEVRKLLEKYEVPVHFSGHMHVQNIKREEKISEIITSSLLISPNQYGVAEIEEDKISYYTKQVDVSRWIKQNKNRIQYYDKNNENNRNNENNENLNKEELLNFSKYAKQFFIQTNLELFFANADGREKEEEQLIQFLVDTNYSYYCGKKLEEENQKEEERQTGDRKEKREKELLAKWKEKDEFIFEYLETILNEIDKGHCTFEWKKDIEDNNK